MIVRFAQGKPERRGIRLSQVACVVKKLGHRSAKYTLIRNNLFPTDFTGEINGNYSEEGAFLLGTSHDPGLGCVQVRCCSGWAAKLLGGQQKGHASSKGRRASLSRSRGSGRWAGYGNLRQSDALTVITRFFATFWLDFATNEFERVLPLASVVQVGSPPWP